MKRFSDRINADWITSNRLEELLDEFFDDDIQPKTLPHLYAWLNTDWVTLTQRSLINEDYMKLITAAKNRCECWIVDHGLGNDKSFAKYLHQTYHTEDTANPTESISNVRIEFVNDSD